MMIWGCELSGAPPLPPPPLPPPLKKPEERGRSLDSASGRLGPISVCDTFTISSMHQMIVIIIIAVRND